MLVVLVIVAIAKAGQAAVPRLIFLAHRRCHLRPPPPAAAASSSAAAVLTLSTRVILILSVLCSLLLLRHRCWAWILYTGCYFWYIYVFCGHFIASTASDFPMEYYVNHVPTAGKGRGLKPHQVHSRPRGDYFLRTNSRAETRKCELEWTLSR